MRSSLTPLRQVRLCIVVVMLGLFVAGVTAFPLLTEINYLAGLLNGGSADLDPTHYSGLTAWILTVREGLEVTYRDYPFIAYGTDWLAFGHLMIMLFFVLPYREPVRYEGVLEVGIWMSVLVFPLALICGPIRGIPWWWRLVDCSFGVGCIPPLWWALRQVAVLKREGASAAAVPPASRHLD